jgi:hypothetical protein
MKGFLFGTVGCVLGGLLGGAVWALIVHFTHYELGIIAWAVGVAAGFGMLIGAKIGGDFDGWPAGLIAAIIAVASLGGSKFANVEILLTRARAEAQSQLQSTMSVDAKVILADQLSDEYTQRKIKLSTEQVEVPYVLGTTSYAKNLWEDCETRWSKMSESEKASYIAAFEYAQSQAMNSATDSNRKDVYKDLFSLYDILWCILAVLSAARIGSGAMDD